MTVTVRLATIEDHEGLARIAAEVGALHASAMPDRFRASADPMPLDHVRSLIEAADSDILVAERAGRVVGYAIVQTGEMLGVPLVVPRQYALLDEIGVLAQEQGEGVGRELVEAAVAWTRERALPEIELNVFEFDDSAAGFYERLGFTTVSRVMALRVDEGAER